MATLHQILPIFVIIAASMVNSQDYDESYSTWFDNPRHGYYSGYYRPYYNVPDPNYYDLKGSGNKWVDDLDSERSEILTRIYTKEFSEDDLQDIKLEDVKIINTDLSCHPNFLAEGIGWMNEIVENCKISSENCVNLCILSELSVLWTEEEETKLEITYPMYPSIRKYFTEDEHFQPSLIIERIQRCEEIAEGLGRVPCSAKIQTVLYECIEQAWSC